MFQEHSGRVFRLQFDEFQIVSSSHDDTILIWDFLEAPAPANCVTSSAVVGQALWRHERVCACRAFCRHARACHWLGCLTLNMCACHRTLVTLYMCLTCWPVWAGSCVCVCIVCCWMFSFIMCQKILVYVLYFVHGWLIDYCVCNACKARLSHGDYVHAFAVACTWLVVVSDTVHDFSLCILAACTAYVHCHIRTCLCLVVFL